MAAYHPYSWEFHFHQIFTYISFVQSILIYIKTGWINIDHWFFNLPCDLCSLTISILCFVAIVHFHFYIGAFSAPMESNNKSFTTPCIHLQHWKYHIIYDYHLCVFFFSLTSVMFGFLLHYWMSFILNGSFLLFLPMECAAQFFFSLCRLW